jgi:hypothetical protein
MGIQVPPDSTGKVVETNSPDGATQRQVVTVGDKTTAARTLTVTAGGAALVDGSATTQPVSAASLPLPTLAATSTKQPALGTAGTAATDVITVQGIASMTKLLVTPDSVALPANQSVNVNQVAGTTADTNSGVKSAGTLRVVLATDQPALTNKLLVTPDSVALPANQSVNVNQVAGTTADTNSGVKSAGTLRVVLATDQPALTNKLLVTPDSVALPANQSVNVNQLAGTTADTNSGTKSAGTLRVVLATDQPQLTNALKVDGSAVTQPVSGTVTANEKPVTSGGLTISHLISAATTNATNVKASAGQVYGWSIFNTNAATRYVKLHNTAGTPTAGSAVVYTIAIPPSGGSNMDISCGLAFATGIAFTTVTGVADSDSAAVGANDLIINIHFF